MKYLLLSLFLGACSSAPQKTATTAPEKITNDAFKKEKPLSNSQIPDFYETKAQSLSPALQDETLDRMNLGELSKIEASADPLLEISVLCAQGNFKDGFDIASKRFNRYQKVAAYWNLIANCHLNAGSFRKALLFYNKALEVSPNYVPALNNIGVMYSRQGQEQKALIAFERASREGKFSKTPRYNLARLYLSYGLAEQALPIFQGLLSESQQDVDLLNATATAYLLLSDYPRALAYYQKIPQTQWKRPEVGLNVALALKKSGRATDAGRVFKMVDEPQGSNLKTYYSSVRAQLGGVE